MSNRLFDLQGKVTIVTGGTGHLGRAICEGMAEAGSNLAVCSTSLDRGETFARQLVQRYDIDAVGFELDLRDLNAIQAVVAAIYSRFQQIDCLVNNAFFGSSNDLLTMSVDEWVLGIDGTVTSSMFMLQKCVPYLEITKGNVVNISSMYGIVSPDPGIYENTPFGNPINYGAGKAALLQLTRHAAVYLAPKGIRVNAISPGPFPNPKVQEDQAFIGKLARKVPLQRIGQPEEISGVAVFLASKAASYITGHNLVVDGGWTIW